jgi:hypothetical protein
VEKIYKEKEKKGVERVMIEGTRRFDDLREDIKVISKLDPASVAPTDTRRGTQYMQDILDPVAHESPISQLPLYYKRGTAFAKNIDPGQNDQ